MSDELQKMQEAFVRLRADLSATNSALLAVMTSLPPDDQQQALTAFAELTVMKEQFAEQSQDPKAKAAMQPLLEAEHRLYQAMQGAYKMRMAKLANKPD